MKKILGLAVSSILAISLAGCMATQTVLNNHSLDVHTRMSDSIFLDPVSSSQKTIYVQTHNTSDQQNIDLKSYLVSDLQKNGYRIVSSPNQAHYLLQVNILKAGKVRPDNATLGLDGTVTGGALGAAASGVTGGHGSDIAIGAVVGALAGNIADAMFKDIGYVIITDVQISERSNVKVNETDTAALKQGTSTTQTLTSKKNSSWNKYRTKVVSTAEKMNLQFSQASPYLAQDLAHSIANIFD